ncbi:MAG: hypothetical protein E7652_07445 [Ruminococcaceae bacterium]|nr:hypothetical protein [Oscillospiraceae bacterium]
MKRFASVLALMLVLVMTLSVTVSAGPDGIIENPVITVPYQSPTIDGVINTDEGWSVAALMNAETLGYFWGHNPLTSDGNIFYAVDDEGISVAGKIVEGLSAVDMSGIDVTGLNQFNYSTGIDDIDIDENGNSYGWNGDVMGLMFDPLGALLNEGFTGADYSSWYLVGLHEGDICKVYRTHSAADGDITDQIQAAGQKTADGWCFEIKLSWDMIIADTAYASMETINLTKDNILKTGNTIRACALYQDRFYDEEQGSVMTWGRYITAPTQLQDGTPGHMGSGEYINSYGINLALGEVPVSDPNGDDTSDTTTAANNDTTAAESEVVDVTDASGNVVTDASGNKVTAVVTKAPSTTKGQNTGATTGQNSTQTLDITIAVALGTLAVSGIGIVASKKRR